jgi:hypothetical protein
MKVVVKRLAILAVALLLVSPVFASALEDKKTEWAFDFNYDDTDNVGKSIDLDVTASWMFAKGRSQVGALVSYFDFDFDDPLDTDVDGLAIGPIYTFNFTPDNDKVTGLGEVAYSITSGDLGDAVDSIIHVGVGARLFVGDSAAVRLVAYYDKAQGADGFADQDATGLSVGISIFTGK